MNWYKKAQNINDKDIENFISNRTGLQIQYNDYEWDDVLGKNVSFINNQVSVNISIKETENEIYLTSIATKDITDQIKDYKGSRKGTEVVNALKEYAKLVNKKLIILDFTEPARTYWDKFDDFTEEGQFYDVDGKNEWIQNTKTYTPYLRDN